jgi:hypothetical protein
MRVWLVIACVLAAGNALAERCPKDPDTTLAGVNLLDAASMTALLGEDYAVVEDDDFPHASLLNAKRGERAKFFFHNGAVQHEAAELAVDPVTREAGTPVSDIRHFVTGRGVRIGQTRAEVVELFGPCVKTLHRRARIETVRYELTREHQPAELRKHGYELYFAEYAFQSGRLVSFRFGFEHP